MGKPNNQKKSWKCIICGAVVEGDTPPDSCPVCGVGPEQFVEIVEEEVEFKSTKDEIFLIIGNGAAGTSACEEIRKRNPVATIEMISTEDRIGYNRPLLTKGVLAQVDVPDFEIKPASWYALNRIQLTLGVTAIELDVEEKRLSLSNGQVRHYDKLILATGSQSFIPPFVGVEKEGVFAIRTLSDVERILGYLPKVSSVVVIGGGVLGIEAAWEICRAGKQVTIIQNANALMDRQLDEKGSAILLKHTEESGISVSLGQRAIAMEGDRAVEGVRMEDGSMINAQMVVLSTGVSPNVSLAKEAGIEADRFINVNEKMETNIKDIYAAGDCAAYEGVSPCIWNQAIDMGKVAGANAAGDVTVYQPVTPANAFSGMGTSLFSVGDSGKDQTRIYENTETYDETTNNYENLYFTDGRFCGAILIGDVSKTARLLQAYQEKATADQLVG